MCKSRRSWASVKTQVIVCYRYFRIAVSKRITFRQDYVYFMVRVLIKHKIFPKNPMKFFTRKSDFSVTHHNHLEAVLVVYMIHENMSFHCRLLLLTAENSSMNLFCHWFLYEISRSDVVPFKGRLPLKSVLFLHFCRWSYAGSPVILTDSGDCEVPESKQAHIFSCCWIYAAVTFWVWRFQFCLLLYFITSVSWVKAFQKVWP